MVTAAAVPRIAASCATVVECAQPRGRRASPAHRRTARRAGAMGGGGARARAGSGVQ